MDHDEWLAARFEEHRSHLRAVAYRLLGSVSEADDALQEAWLRLSRSDMSGVENVGAWLTTVVARVSLNMLRSRKARREQSLEARFPDPIVASPDSADPERQAVIADSVGFAMLIVLQTLAPAERVAFVLHDMFAVPFDEIAWITERSGEAARQLASRARRRVRQAPVPDPDLARQREVVDAFAAAAQEGDFAALMTLLDPDIVLREDAGPGRPDESVVVRGARAVAERAASFAHLTPYARPVLVNGAVGALVAPDGRPFAPMCFTVSGDKIVEIDVLADPLRLSELNLAELL
jgi:RNA polymerase sigma factor (sigma-70 family)